MTTPVSVKRSQLAQYLNVGTALAPDYVLIGDGITSASINYNPQTSEEIYIHEDSGTTEVESYKPTEPIEATAKKGDDVFDFIEAMARARAVLADAHTDIVTVYVYLGEQTPGAGDYHCRTARCIGSDRHPGRRRRREIEAELYPEFLRRSCPRNLRGQYRNLHRRRLSRGAG